MGAFGVELPENFDAPTTETPEPKTADTGVELGNAQSSSEAKPPETIQELLDLDKHERFRWQGREWSPKELQNAIMMREDYTKKTTSLAETRKYADNFDVDLEKVLAKPELLDVMRNIYPPQYMKVAERILERMNGQPATRTEDTKQSPDVSSVVQKLLDKELGPIKQTFSQISQEKHKVEVERVNTWLDSTYEKLLKKYPSANTALIDTRALSAHEQGHKVTEEVLDRLFKQAHDEAEAWYSNRAKKQVEEQKKANAAAKDTGAGGGTPTMERKKESIAEARKRMLEDVEATA